MKIKLSFLLLITLLGGCKTARNDRTQKLPFDDPLQFFKGTYKRFDSSFHFDNLSYTHSITHKYGAVQEQGLLSPNLKNQTIQFVPEYFICMARNKKMRIKVDEFKKIVEDERKLLIGAYNRKLHDPDGLKVLLSKFKEAELSNDQAALSQEISQEIAQNNVNALQTFLDFIASMRDDIIAMEKKVDELQIELQKKQKEIDLIDQQKIEERHRIDELNTLRAERVKEKTATESEMAGIVETIEQYRNKIELLLQENPVDEDDLKKALADLKGIEQYLQYTKDRRTYIKSNQQYLIDLIKENEDIIAKLENYQANMDKSRTYYFKITELQLMLDNKPINATSPIYEYDNGESPPTYVANCQQAALILMTRYLEELEQIPDYQKKS